MDKENRLSILGSYASIYGIPIGILAGILISWTFLSLQTEKRVPVILFDKPVEVLNLKKLSEMHYIGLDCNYSVYPVKHNVYLQKFYFWNDGRKTIDAADILKPISLVPYDTNAAIVDVNILTQSRDIIGANISVNVGQSDAIAIKKKWVPTSSCWDDSSCIPFRFKFLEHGDGFNGQVVYVADGPTEFRIRGIIKETKGIRTTIPQARFTFKFAGFLGAILLELLSILLLIFLCLLFSGALGRFYKRIPNQTNSKGRIARLMAIVIISLFIVCMGVVLRLQFVKLAQGAKGDIPSSIFEQRWIDNRMPQQ